MNAFLEQFGINWKLFLSQLINFALILVVLNFFVYKPILKIIKKRNEKIKEGLDKAQEAAVRLQEVDHIGKQKMKEAQSQAQDIIKATYAKAKDLEAQLQKKIEDSHMKEEKELHANYKKQQQEAQALVIKNAIELVKKTVIKTVELDPEAVDEALIKKAIESTRHGT